MKKASRNDCSHVRTCFVFALHLQRMRFGLGSSSVSNVHTYQFTWVYFSSLRIPLHFFFAIRLRIILGRTKVMVMLCLSLFYHVFFFHSNSLILSPSSCICVFGVLKTVIIATTEKPRSILPVKNLTNEKWKIVAHFLFLSLSFSFDQ